MTSVDPIISPLWCAGWWQTPRRDSAADLLRCRWQRDRRHASSTPAASAAIPGHGWRLSPQYLIHTHTRLRENLTKYAHICDFFPALSLISKYRYHTSISSAVGVLLLLILLLLQLLVLWLNYRYFSLLLAPTKNTKNAYQRRLVQMHCVICRNWGWLEAFVSTAWTTSHLSR